MYVDTHCHIDRYADPVAALSRAKQARVATFAVTETPSKFRMLQLLLGHREHVRVALGIHPLRAQMISDSDYRLFSELLDRTDLVGEVGLDRSEHGKSSFDRQVQVFEWILEEPSIRTKLLSVHSRGAGRETVDRIAAAQVTAVMHWYSGPLSVIDRALAAGCYFSINSAMLRSKGGRSVLARLPEDRVLTETVGPFIKHGFRDICPSDIPSVVKGLGEFWGKPANDVAGTIATNLSIALSGNAAARSPRGAQPQFAFDRPL